MCVANSMHNIDSEVSIEKPMMSIVRFGDEFLPKPLEFPIQSSEFKISSRQKTLSMLTPKADELIPVPFKRI